jgi:hypothetical protein
MRQIPVTKADQRYFTRDDEVYSITLRYLYADDAGPWSTWQRLVHMLRDAGIDPLGGRGGAHGQVFLHADTDRALP